MLRGWFFLFLGVPVDVAPGMLREMFSSNLVRGREEGTINLQITFVDCSQRGKWTIMADGNGGVPNGTTRLCGSPHPFYWPRVCC